MNRLVPLFIILILSFQFALASDFSGLDADCYSNSVSLTGNPVQINFGFVAENRTTFTLKNSCDSNNEIDYDEPIILTLGPVQEDEVIITDEWVYVDSTLRPDLDVPATIRMNELPYIYEPDILKDGLDCGSDCTVQTYVNGVLVFNVSGFSNYSLSGRQDFNLYSDEAPELQGKIYQTIDLGVGYRSQEFSCVIMVFAEDRDGELALIQTNPEREPKGRLFGDVDTNQPESLGYFRTQNGVANVYYRNDLLAGYAEYQYVASCQSNTTQLIYEETFRPVITPLGRQFTAWSIWFNTDNDGENNFLIVFYVIVGVVVLWLVVLFYRVTRKIGGG